MLRLVVSSFCLVTTATIVGCSSEDSPPASESRATSIVEQATKKENFSFDTPEAAFEAFAQALQEKDWSKAISAVTAESQKMLASGLVRDASFSTFEETRDWPDDGFEWSKAPDQLATISGHWSLKAGTIYFSSEGKTVPGW